MSPCATLQELAAALDAHGLILRSGFAFDEGVAAPPGPRGEPAHAVVLVGDAGDSSWPHFRKWAAAQGPLPDDPLDAWSRAVLDPVAEHCGARAVFPFEKPWLPFQRWAVRAEGLRPSPLGILMHPQFGLWHAWRGALLFDVEMALPTPDNPIHLCDTCVGKDCMNTCPVGAVGEQAFDVAGCAGFLLSGGDCGTIGCRARAACPHGKHRYGDDKIAFHMAARLGSLRET
ncbi:hypothetical protein [Oricola sp.]|uniref:hypothetical protein n=1 Tax=Oricola sp. TaxID=1979950 RepID=UPI0025E7AD0C|nr:hypothetical protein [Oricola sp.]MCI5076213.1 hypothetical protein [Oricola sp.]